MACDCMNSKLFPHRKSQCMWKSINKLTSDATNSLKNSISSNDKLGQQKQRITVDEGELEQNEVGYAPSQRKSNDNMFESIDSIKIKNKCDETWVDLSSGNIDNKCDENNSSKTEVLNDYVLVDKFEDAPSNIFSLDKVSSMSEFEQELIQKAKKNKSIMKARISLNTTVPTNAPPTSTVTLGNNV